MHGPMNVKKKRSSYCDTEAVSKHVPDEERVQKKVHLERSLLIARHVQLKMAKCCCRIPNVSCIAQREGKTSRITSQSGLCRGVCMATVRGAA